jgi:hypothetical protein
LKLENEKMEGIKGDEPSLRQPVEDSVPSILRRAADLIEPKGRWHQGSLAATAIGNTIGPQAPGAVCWCAMGAIIKESGGNDGPAYRALAEVIGRTVPDFNDDPATSQEMVVAALRAAADRAEQVSA